jgi:hypothetical protein
MESSEVGVLVRPIPDGAVSYSDKPGVRLRLSLVLLPDATKEGEESGTKADLRKWPASVRNLIKRIVVRTRSLKKTGGLTPPITISADSLHRSGFNYDERWQEAAQKLWDAIFVDVGNYGGFAEVLRIIKNTQTEWDHLGIVDRRTGTPTPRLNIANTKLLEAAVRGIHAHSDLAFLLAHRRGNRAPWEAATRGPLDPLLVEQDVSRLFAVHRPAVSANQVPDVEAEKADFRHEHVLLALLEIAAEEHALDESDTDDAVVLKHAEALTAAIAQRQRPQLDEQFMRSAQAIDNYLADGASSRFAVAAERYRGLRADGIGTPSALQSILEAERKDGSMSDWWQQMLFRGVNEAGMERLFGHAPTNDEVFEAMAELVVPQVFRDAADLHELAAKRAPNSTKLARARLAIQHEFAAFRLSLREGLVPDVLTQTQIKRDENDIQLTPREKIERKLAGVYAYPSLARFLGLIVDVEIEADAIKLGDDFPQFGFISAELEESEIGLNTKRTTNWTAFKRFSIAPTVDGTRFDYFRPLPSDELLDALRPERQGRQTYRSLDGLLNLGQQLPTKRPRYALMSLDTTAATRSMEVVGHHVATAQAAGEAVDRINTFLPPKRTIGIALIDGARADELAETLARARDLVEQHTTFSAQRDVLLFSEDVEIGYRLSMARKTIHEKGTKWRFHSLHERSLQIEQIPRDYISKRLAFRDVGYIRTGGRVVVKEVSPLSGFSWNESLLTQALAVWRNWSLAVPAPSPDHPAEVVSCEEGELPLTINIGLPEKVGGHIPPELRLPPLRYGDEYAAVAEIVFQNGSSIGRSEAHRLVQTATHSQAALPAPDGGDWVRASGFRFLRESPIGAPTIHLAEPLHQPSNSESNLGEQVRRMVVRTGKLGPKEGVPSRRFAVPPRIEAEVADLHGSFDSLTEMPEGALRRFRINKAAMLPTLTLDGKITFQETDDENSKKHGIGTIVVVNKGAAVRPEQPFFPDPLADRMIAMVDVPETGLGDDGVAEALSFYAIGKNKVKYWPDAYPILIELQPVQSFSGSKDFRLNVEPRNHDGILVNTLIIELAPAREIQLTLWCLPNDPSKLKGMHAGVADIEKAAEHFTSAINDTIRAFSKGGAAEGLADKSDLIAQDIDDLAKGLVGEVEELPVPSICHVETMTLLHAVQTPLRAPSVPRQRILDPVLGDFKFVRIVPSPSPHAPQGTSWEERLKAANDDLTKVADDLRGTVAYIGGIFEFDRRSTEWIECRGFWTEYDDSKGPLDFSADPHTEYTIEERAHRTLFLVGPIPRLYSLRNLNYDFRDTRARRMSIDLIATSRFSEEFTQPSLAERQAPTIGSVSEFQAKSAIATDYWLPSTDHPKLPEFLDDETTVSRLSVTDYGVDPYTGFRYAARTTQSYLHVRLARPWFSSGEGEMLGLVLWPPTIVTDVPSLKTEGSLLCDPTGDTIVTPGKENENAVEEWTLDSQLEPYISRWGADATRGTFRGMVAFPPMLITPDVITNADAKPVRPLRMPLPSPQAADLRMTLTSKDGLYRDAERQYRHVAVAAFKVKPHVETQTWYCDIGLHPHHDDQTRVRLSLVRYQEHSLPGLELSSPVVKEVKLLPKRTLKVLLVNDRTVRVQVFGHSYDKKEVRAQEQDIARLANVAYMAIELKQLFAKQAIIDEEQPIAGPMVKFTATVTPQVYQPLAEKLPIGSDLMSVTKLFLSPRFDGATAVWESGNITFDNPWTSQQFVLLVRELELVASAVSDPDTLENELELPGLTQRQTYFETLIIRGDRPKH